MLVLISFHLISCRIKFYHACKSNIFSGQNVGPLYNGHIETG